MDEPTGMVTLDDIPTVKEILNQPQVNIHSLVVSPMPRLELALGNSDSFVRMVKSLGPKVKAVIWNESGIALLMDDRTTLVGFIPELRPEAAMFFERHEKRSRDRDDSEIKVWEGEYAPIQFTKRNLIKFVEKYSAQIDGGKDLTQAVKKMNVKQLVAEQSEMLDDVSDNNRTMIEESLTTNVPSSFKMRMNLAENLIGELTFQVDVAKKKDNYGNDTKDWALVLRCVNGREVMQATMNKIIDRLPEDIPRYYGAMRIGSGKEARY